MHERRVRVFRALPLLCVLLLASLTPASAVDADRKISQFGHTAWRIRDGIFNSTANAITQTTDGYLWIGTENGLVRFDGVRFVPWKPPAGQQLDDRIFSLRATRDGTLWIGTGRGLSFLKNGNVVNVEVGSRINSIVEDPAGNGVWIVRTRPREANGPLCHVTGRTMRCYGKDKGILFDSAAHLTRGPDDSFWFGGRNGLVHWVAGNVTHFFREELAKHEGLYGVGAIATESDGSTWISVEQAPGTPAALRQFSKGQWITHPLPRAGDHELDVTSLFIDREHTVWIGTGGDGLYRLHGGQFDRFAAADGLSGDDIGRMHQDHEGNVWVATSQGIDVFRNARVVSYSVREGLTADSVSSIVASADGKVWIGNVGALDVMQNGKLTAIRKEQGFPGRTISALFSDHAGRLWIGIDRGLFVYDGKRFLPITKPDGTRTGLVMVMTEDVDRNMWIQSSDHLFRARDLKIEETVENVPGAFSLAPDPKGGIWIGQPNATVSKFAHGKIEHFPPPANREDGSVLGLVVDPDSSVWAAVQTGLVRLVGKERRLLGLENGLPCRGIYALQDDDQRGLWLYTQCGVVSIARSELDKWWARPDTVVKLRTFDLLDGAQPGMSTFTPAVTRSPDGRIWFANDRIVQMVDPARLERNSKPPAVHIERVVADRRSHAPQANLRLPALTRDIEIDYTALSFTSPQKVRFRYKLENRDTDWQYPETRRQAFYSDLPPGNYTFRVIACNNDGVWNEAGASLQFNVAAAWYQTNWFRALAVIAALLLIWVLYRLRLRQIARSISARFDERLAERTRIARELHDTLLQTIQASKMVANEVLTRSDDPVQTRRGIERLSGWLDQAVQEGRAALNSLRTSTTQENDLARAFRQVAENCEKPDSMEISLSVVGSARDMHPIVRDEIYRIGYEAIRNACTHSNATKLDIELRYEKELTLRVRDNGVGMAADTVESGKDGHYGLPGMRERADHIGATFTIVSASSGTEVTVIIPESVVFLKRSQ
ncbi:MAG TPA: two-component regulator propeller domain-containing protein [Thermoanaerobaculia bacterium]|nr:two-component regulator propeller domain-containing protein [Thermoanaerobaculia bacterium]